MQQHFFHEHLAGVFHSQGNHGQAVTDQDDIHASMIGDVGAWKIVGSHGGDGLSLSVKTPQCAQRNLLPLKRRRCAHGRVGAVSGLTWGDCER